MFKKFGFILATCILGNTAHAMTLDDIVDLMAQPTSASVQPNDWSATDKLSNVWKGSATEITSTSHKTKGFERKREGVAHLTTAIKNHKVVNMNVTVLGDHNTVTRIVMDTDLVKLDKMLDLDDVMLKSMFKHPVTISETRNQCLMGNNTAFFYRIDIEQHKTIYLSIATSLGTMEGSTELTLENQPITKSDWCEDQ